MLKNMWIFMVSALVSAQALALDVSPGDRRVRSVSASVGVMRLIDHGTPAALSPKTAEQARYVFVFCAAGVEAANCPVIGDPHGYSREQIAELWGRWKQAGAWGLGAGEAVLGVIAGAYVASFTFIGATTAWGLGGLGTTTGLVGGATLGVAVPVGIITFTDTINPVRIYDKGGVESKMKRSLRELVESGAAALVIYQDTNVDEVLEIANQVEEILSDFEQ